MLPRAAIAALRDIAHHIDLAVRFAAGLVSQSFEPHRRTVEVELSPCASTALRSARSPS
jgi:hypothetical protein